MNDSNYFDDLLVYDEQFRKLFENTRVMKSPGCGKDQILGREKKEHGMKEQCKTRMKEQCKTRMGLGCPRKRKYEKELD